jgi:gliding motility-associated-like protein
MKYFFIILNLFPFFFKAQLITSSSMSPTQLAQNVLLGPGVEISNISFSGVSQAIGYFTANGTNLGIAEGIVITTGTISGSDGPQGPNTSAGSGTDNNYSGSSLLSQQINNNSTFNAATLEFDFTAVGDEVSFKYVFGSEEYLEYVDLGFNDVFALFISGPGISGNQNIARLPNNTVVTIDNVNNNSNSFYYVDNGDGNESPYNSSNQYIQYDGFTKVLVAQSQVECGEKYHLTIAIADVGDGILDSGIFLEAQSLKSNAPYTSDFNISDIHFGADDVVAEGCTSADIVVNRIDATNPVTFPIQIQGSATEGVDYDNIPDEITFNAGQTEFTFNLNIFSDGLTEGTETIDIILMVLNECLELDPDTIHLEIRNVEPISVNLVADSLNCGPGEVITISPIVTGGLEPYTYLWSTNETTSFISISPPSTQTFSVSVTDACLISTDDDDAEIFVADIPPLGITPIIDVSVLCPNTPEFLTAVAFGGSGGYTYVWKKGNFVVGLTDTITLSPLETTTYTVIATDLCGLQTSIPVVFTVTTPLLIPAITTPDPICPSDTVTITASATLGLGQYSYLWDHSGETTSSITVSPTVTTTYYVSISDECQSYSVPITSTVTVFVPVADFSFSTSNLETGAQIQFMDNSTNAINYSWDLGNGSFSIEENPITTYNEVGTYYVTLIIQDELGCYDTVTKPINIGYLLYIPNTFTPDGNKYNNEFFSFSVNIDVLSFELYNRWGELIYFSENETRFRWDGSYKGKPCEDDTYTYRIRFVNPSREEIVFIGHVNLLR